MPSRDWEFRINDIIEAIEKIGKYLDGVEFEKFSNESMIIDAVIRNFEIIGEATAHLPKEVQEKSPAIPWRQMKEMQNLLIHEYFGVDIEVIWHTATNDQPLLKKQLQNIL